MDNIKGAPAGTELIYVAEITPHKLFDFLHFIATF